MMPRFVIDEATLVRDAEWRTLDEVLNQPDRADCELVAIVPIYGFGRVKVVWRRRDAAAQ